MTLILKQKESSFRRWYAKNKERLSQERRLRYAQDPKYRQRALEASRRRRRGESNPSKPPDDTQISFAQAADNIGMSVSTLHEWRRKKLFPEPKHYGGRIWFSEKQVLLLTKLREVIRVYGNRGGKVKQHQLKEMVASIGASWD
jgi:predicted DNA-binding transcriptional regulator AlpA